MRNHASHGLGKNYFGLHFIPILHNLLYIPLHILFI